MARISSLSMKRKNQKLKTKVVLKKCATDFCDSTTLHGFKYLTESGTNIYEKIFFGISIVVVSAVSVQFIYNVYDKWDRNPVIVALSPTRTYINKVPFPAITICNMNQISARAAKQYSNTSFEYYHILNFCNREEEIPEEILSQADTTFDWNSYTHFMQNVSQTCQSMILKCMFGGKIVKCTDYFIPILSDEGYCCAFNTVSSRFMFTREARTRINHSRPIDFVAVDWSNENGYPEQLPTSYYPVTAEGPGESKGLSIILNADIEDYFCSSTNTAGFKVLLHNPTETPLIKELGLIIQAGYESKFRILAEKMDASPEIKDIKVSSRNCLFTSEVNLLYFRTYSKRNCEMECEAAMFLRHCNCIRHYMPRIYGNVSICGLSDLKCIEKKITSYKGEREEEKSCNEICLPGCFDLTFLPDSFSADLESGNNFMVKDDFVEKFDKNHVTKNLALVHFYYKDNSYRGYMQSQYIGMTEFLSNTGGLMGLFIGFSFISCAEIFYFGVIKVYLVARKQKNLEKLHVKLKARKSKLSLIDGQTINIGRVDKVKNDQKKQPTFEVTKYPYIE